MTDHKQQALDLLGSVHLDTGDVYDQSIGARNLRLRLAGVHATLYLAEQQRIANLIALGHLDAAAGRDPHGPVQELIPENERVVEELGPFSTTITAFRLRKDIREALALS